MSDGLLDKKQLAEKLKCNPRTVSRLEKKGLPVIWVASLKRYNYDDVLVWLDEQYNRVQKGGE